MKRRLARSLVWVVLCVCLSSPVLFAESQNLGDRGDLVYIFKPITLRVSGDVLLSFDINYASLDCNRTGSCAYRHPPCAPWVILKEKEDSFGRHIRIRAALQTAKGVASSSYTVTRLFSGGKELTLRLYGDYPNVLSGSVKACIDAMRSPPSNEWAPIYHSGIWTSWKGFEIASTGAIGIVFSEDLEITEVIEKGPAHLAGLAVGDLLRSVNGVEVKAIRDVKRLLSGPQDSWVELTASREGIEKHYSIRRRGRGEVLGDWQEEADDQ